MERDTSAFIGKVLVINDVPSIGDRLVRWLAQQGYHCVLANSSEEARLLLGHNRFDAILHGREFTFLRN